MADGQRAGLQVHVGPAESEELDDESDPTGMIRFFRDQAAETAKNIAYERETQRLVDLADPKRH